MDRNEAIKHLKVVLKTCDVQDEEAVEMAVEALNCSEIPNNSDTISRQAALDKIKKRMFETAFNNIGIKQDVDETLADVAENRLENWFDELPSVQPEQRWIPVTEILPENDDKVLITHSHGISMAWWNGRYWTGSMIKKYKTVTAWMPLPEPYKGEQE